MTGGGKPRVGIVNTHPIQYFAPLYARLARSGLMDLTVLYLSDVSLRGAVDKGFGETVKWDIDLLAGYDNAFVGSNYKTAPPDALWSFDARGLWSEIRRRKFDAVLLHGHVIPANYVAAAAARMVGTKILMRSETHLGLKRSGAKAALRNVAIRAFYRQCDAFLAIGDANRVFYRAFGVDDARIFTVPYAVDNDRFMRQSSLSAEERRALRAELGVEDDTPIVLFASKFQRRKHPDAVVRAVAALEKEGRDVALAMVGAGEMAEELRAAVAAGGPRRTTFTGFINQSRLPAILGACDVFVLPSDEEPWGLVVNEAMCAGLPVVIGEELGCAANLVAPGRNGFTVPAGDARAIADALRSMLADAATRRAMGEESRRIVAAWGYDACVEGWRAVLNSLFGHGAVRPGTAA